MNNLRLLTGLLGTVLLSCGVCASGQAVITLDEIFASAEAASTQLRPFLTAIEEAEMAVVEARGEKLPDIGADLSLSYIGNGFTTKRNFSNCQRAEIPHFGNGLTLSVTQPLYTGGAITAAIDMARQKSTASRLNADLQRDNIRFWLCGLYLDLYKYANLRKVVDCNIAQARKVLAGMNARYEQGTVLRNDVTRYELLVSNLCLQLVKIDNMLGILNNNLVTVAGLPANTVLVPDSSIIDRALPNVSESRWLDDAHRLSPAVNLARKEVDINLSAQKLVNSYRLPKIGLQARWTIDGPILVEVPPFNRNFSYWYVGIGVSYNLSSLYKTDKSMARSRVAIRKAVEQFESVNENLDMTVHADYVRYLEAYEELKTQQKSVELAASNYATVFTRYAEGMALITDLLDAANSRLTAEQNLVNARIDIIYYYYKLLYTSGKI